jgi:hypothetical protein
VASRNNSGKGEEVEEKFLAVFLFPIVGLKIKKQKREKQTKIRKTIKRKMIQHNTQKSFHCTQRGISSEERAADSPWSFFCQQNINKQQYILLGNT